MDSAVWGRPMATPPIGSVALRLAFARTTVWRQCALDQPLTAFFRQARCTAQVQPGGCEAKSLEAKSSAGAAAGMAALARAAREGMEFRVGASQRSISATVMALRAA